MSRHPLPSESAGPISSYSPPYARRDWLLLGVVLAVALILRTVRLSTVPPGINGDELFNAVDALRIGKSWPIFLPGNKGREVLFIYAMAASMRIAGETIIALRLPAVLLGTGSVALAFLIGRDWFNRQIAWLGAGLAAVSLWPIMTSRWGLRAISLTFFTGLTILLFTRALAQGRLRDWLLAGVSLGLTLNTYIPSRVFPLVIAGWLLWEICFRRPMIRHHWRRILFSWILAIVVYAPLGWYSIRHPEAVNRRINESADVLTALQRGEVSALLEPAGRVLHMFVGSGDPDWRYHVAREPLFDPVTGIFFFAGLALCLWWSLARSDAETSLEKRPLYALLLMWAGAMLAPNVLSGDQVSFLRAAGAIIPLYLITAVGFAGLVDAITRRWEIPKPYAHFPSLAAGAGMVIILANSWHSYFVIWANHPAVREIYQADLAAIGRYLASDRLPPDTRIFVGHPRAFDAAPTNLAYYTRTPISWFIPASSFAWGTTTEQAARYLVPADEPLSDVIVSRLGPDVEIGDIRFADDEVAFRIYERAGPLETWQPEHPHVVQFSTGLRLLGYTVPNESVRGDLATVELHWQVAGDRPPAENQLTFIQVQVEDESGNVWHRNSRLLGFPESGWQPFDRFVQFLDLEIPEGMPPGVAYFRFQLHDNDGNPIAQVTASDQATAPERAGPMLVRSRPLQDFRPGPETLVFADRLALDSSAFSSLLMPGLDIDIGLNWVALQSPQLDYRLQLQLVEPGTGEQLLKQAFSIWPETYPTSRWQAGEPVSTFHRLRVPADLHLTADPELRLFLLPPDGDEPISPSQGDNLLARLTLVQREHLFAPPPISQLLSARFGLAIQLLGYDIDSSHFVPGGKLELTLYWQALTTPAKGYTVFNHLLDESGQLQGQFDNPPVGDAWLTQSWLPGEIVVDRRTIPVSEAAPVGRYRLAIGLYTVSDGRRLPVTVEGELQADSQLILTELTIRE